jgi:hypothetical protein
MAGAMYRVNSSPASIHCSACNRRASHVHERRRVDRDIGRFTDRRGLRLVMLWYEELIGLQHDDAHGIKGGDRHDDESGFVGSGHP